MKAYFMLLVPFLAICTSCTLRVPVQTLETPATVAKYFYCRVGLDGYFNEKYGFIKTGKRGMVIVQFTIPQYAFLKSDNSSKRKRYKPSKNSDNRVIFYVDNKTVASGIVDSIVISDNSVNDVIEFRVSKSFGGIGFVGQGRNSLVVKLSDGQGTLLEDIENLPFEQSTWNGFVTSSNSTVYLTVDAYRKRTGLSEVFTVDGVKAECV